MRVICDIEVRWPGLLPGTLQAHELTCFRFGTVRERSGTVRERLAQGKNGSAHCGQSLAQRGNGSAWFWNGSVREPL
jgi:hypothetical protein